jgi:hypothetical protein
VFEWYESFKENFELLQVEQKCFPSVSRTTESVVVIQKFERRLNFDCPGARRNNRNH